MRARFIELFGEPVRPQRVHCAASRYPQRTDLAVTWKGPCVDGVAQEYGTLTWSNSGEFFAEYEGQVADGRPQGLGCLVRPYKDSGLYEALYEQFSEGFPNGTVILCQPGKPSKSLMFVRGEPGRKTEKESSTTLEQLELVRSAAYHGGSVSCD